VQSFIYQYTLRSPQDTKHIGMKCFFSDKHEMTVPSGTSHHKSPNVFFPSKPPNKRKRDPMEVME